MKSLNVHHGLYNANMDIKDAFAQSIFLFGAGASYGTGCKMSKEMLDVLLNEIMSYESVFSETQKESLKFLLSCLEYHNKWRSFQTDNKFIFDPNIEELALLIRRVKNRENFLPYPITGNWADKLRILESEHNQSSDSESLFASLDRIIKRDLLPRWLEFDESRLNFMDPLKQLLEDYADIDFVIELFTLNNDLIIESYFGNKGMMPWRGFSNNDWRGMDIEESSCKINLYKLHGSLDWVRLESGEVKESNKCSVEETRTIDSLHNPYVIFGHGTKTFSVDPFFNLIHCFKTKLDRASYIFVIGYSFFDPYINNMIIEAVNSGNKKLFIINPSFGPKEIKYKLNQGQVQEATTENGDSTSNILAEYIEAIQANPFYSEMPEFNIKHINGESTICYYQIGIAEFIKHFFSNKGQHFLELIQNMEQSKLKEEYPFA